MRRSNDNYIDYTNYTQLHSLSMVSMVWYGILCFNGIRFQCSCHYSRGTLSLLCMLTSLKHTFSAGVLCPWCSCWQHWNTQSVHMYSVPVVHADNTETHNQCRWTLSLLFILTILKHTISVVELGPCCTCLKHWNTQLV